MPMKSGTALRSSLGPDPYFLFLNCPQGALTIRFLFWRDFDNFRKCGWSQASLLASFVLWAAFCPILGRLLTDCGWYTWTCIWFQVWFYELPFFLEHSSQWTDSLLQYGLTLWLGKSSSDSTISCPSLSIAYGRIGDSDSCLGLRGT